MPSSHALLIESLRTFAEGRLTPDEMGVLVDRVIIAGPQVIKHELGELDVVFKPALDAAFYLDFVLDSGPNQDLVEARDLAAALAALLKQGEPSDLILSDLLQLARWRLETARRISDYLGGRLNRAGFERFVVRRPWPTELQHVVGEMPDPTLERLGASLRSNDWNAVRTLLGGHAA